LGKCEIITDGGININIDIVIPLAIVARGVGIGCCLFTRWILGRNRKSDENSEA
jgi:isopentenyl diphosphate isomerase/L-lactate dehydrogenase-like FMN-dependent dehydrogenase